MNRRLIIFIIILLFVLAGIGIAWWYITSRHDVTIDFGRDDMKVTVERRESATERHTVATLDHTDTIKLPDGDYIIAPESTDQKRPLSKDVTRFTVDGENQKITVTPELSDSYRNELLDQSRDHIHSVITANYPTIFDQYNVTHEEILGKNGEWYGIELSEKMPDSSAGDTYFIALNKQDGEWKLASTPELILTVQNAPGVPRDIISRIDSFYQAQDTDD